MIRHVVLFIALTAPVLAQDWPGLFAERFQARQTEGDDADYRNGLRALDASQWERAIAAFNASAARRGTNVDAALYWTAYAENKAGRREEALATVARLTDSYPKSRWVNDAQILALEVRSQTGAAVSPGAESDEELKLLALNSLMQSDPEKALPVLERVLSGNGSTKLKERALFVLTQNSSPQARKILSDTARGTANPDLRMKAIHYMGMMGGEESRKELAAIYSSSTDEHVKREILRSFMTSGSRSLLFNVAKSEQNPELRHEAIRQLALTGGQDELWQLYQAESSVDNKAAILKSMFLSGNSSRLIEVARSEKDPNLRVAAIKSLGLMGKNGRADVLVSIYQSDQNPAVRKEVLNALFLQGDGKSLVDLARSEKDPAMKQEIVKKMALVHSKEVTDYMMEILR